MPNKRLALALAGLVTVTPCGWAEESEPAGPRLERRAAERGPIRQQLEAALAVPASAITAQAVEEARRAARGASSTATGTRTHPLIWVLIGLACLFALWSKAGTIDF